MFNQVLTVRHAIDITEHTNVIPLLLSWRVDAKQTLYLLLPMVQQSLDRLAAKYMRSECAGTVAAVMTALHSGRSRWFFSRFRAQRTRTIIIPLYQEGHGDFADL